MIQRKKNISKQNQQKYRQAMCIWSAQLAKMITNPGTKARTLLSQTAETLTHLRHRPRPSKAPISHWTAVHFCNGCPSGGARSMSQGLRVLVLLAGIAALLITTSAANAKNCLIVNHSD